MITMKQCPMNLMSLRQLTITGAGGQSLEMLSSAILICQSGSCNN